MSKEREEWEAGISSARPYLLLSKTWLNWKRNDRGRLQSSAVVVHLSEDVLQGNGAQDGTEPTKQPLVNK